MIDKNKIIDAATNHFNALRPAAAKPKLRPVKMTINGQTIALSNGKAVWKRIGDAKNALRLEFDNCWKNIRKQYGLTGWQERLPGHTWESEKELAEEVYQFVLTNIIRFEDA